MGNFKRKIVKTAHIEPTYFEYDIIYKTTINNFQGSFFENVYTGLKWKLHQKVHQSVQINLSLPLLHLPYVKVNSTLIRRNIPLKNNIVCMLTFKQFTSPGRYLHLCVNFYMVNTFSKYSRYFIKIFVNINILLNNKNLLCFITKSS